MVGHLIEHEVGIYVGLLLLACSVGVILKHFAHLPYTIALTLVGLVIGILHLGPPIEETGFGKELVFFVMLPPLLFQGALHLNLTKLLEHVTVIAAFAILGVVLSTATLGLMLWGSGAIDDLLVCLLFGAMLAATDPVSVLALFKELHVPEDLKTLVEGESLLNDGTAVVVFSILLAMIAGAAGGAGAEGGGAATFSIGGAILTFVKVAAGGFVLGFVFGWAAYQVLLRIEDHLLENAICLVLAYGAFWVGEVAHVSGVIATVVAGLLIGNPGRRHGMSEKTKTTIETFFESLDFLINSVLFILVGLELQTLEAGALRENAWVIGVAIVALLVSRAVAVYPLFAATHGLGSHRPFVWSHVLWWGGLRGSIPVALLVSLNSVEALAPYRPTLLVAGFGAVFFSLVVQGITVKPLLRMLGLVAVIEREEAAAAATGAGAASGGP